MALVYFVVSVFSLCIASAVTQKIAMTYNLRENQENGTFVGNVARDTLLYGNISELEFQRLKFTFFTQGNPHAMLFNIDEQSSTIRTDKVIDREAICILQISCFVILDIAIYMRDPVINDYDLYKLMKVKVVIDDVNDNSPTFPQSRIKLIVPESVPKGHILLTSGAIDEDMGVNNSIRSYDLIPSTGLFGLKVVKNWDGSSDLGIIVKHPLDRETRDNFQVKVIAKDGGYPIRTGSVIIDITVTDVNDNRPVFLNNTYNISVYENIPFNRTVLQLVAIDTDNGMNSKITYGYSSRVAEKIKQDFKIDPNTGRIYAVGKIDYEQTKQYQFMVEAKDGGTPQLSTQALVTIDVMDENDNVPQININLTPEGTDISEAVDTKKFVAHISVSDLDSGRNKLVKCSMSDSHFILEDFFDNSYKIVLGEKLDYERQSSHNVTVTCSDDGRVPLVNTSSFIVHVLDENDNFPEFSQTVYTGSIIENNDVGEDILQVSAQDKDSDNNGHVQYSINGDANKFFSINSKTGMIKTRTTLDREAIPEFKFNVIATDFGKEPKSQAVDVIIKVLDQNDQPPKFKQPVFFCYVLENLKPGASAGNVTAIDNDTKTNGDFLFTIPINSWARDYFAIHPRTGEVTTKKKFDRESNSQYNFVINVRDPQVPGFADTANVTVFILDDNDNVPIIDFPTAKNFTNDIAFETAVGTVITTIEAHDSDETSNAKIIYMLKSGNNYHLFNLNRMTGELAVSRIIRPEDSGLYKLEIMVSDSGNPPLSARTKFYVNVAETNGTHGFEDTSEKDKNMLIVVCLVVVTLILGIAIVTTICLIKRIDKERQQRTILGKIEEEKMYSVVKKDESFSSSDMGDELKEKKTKEVNFCLKEEIDHNTSSSSRSTSFSTFKSNQKNGIIIKCDNYNDMSHSNRISINDELPPPPARWSLQTKDDESYYPDFLYKFSPFSSCRDSLPLTVQAHKLMEILKKGEDVVSESSGETGTSDSGRGGSDEEASHKDLDDTQNFHNNSFYPNGFNRFSDGRQSSLSVTSGHSSFNRPTTNGNYNNQRTDTFHDLSKPKYSQDNMYNIQNFTPRPLEFIDESFRTGASSYCDDDASTTSGSYTINPEELQTEINGLFFNDVVV